MHIGRHRMRSHAGIPQGSTCNIGNALHIYYQCNTGESGLRWNDQSINVNNADQTTEVNRPAAVTGGGLDFEDSDDVDNASMMDFTTFTVSADLNFLMFIVWNPETTSSSAYLSDSNTEVFQQTSGNQALFKTGGGAAATTMTHGGVGIDIFSIDTGEKSVFMIERTQLDTGTIKLYKNGLVCDGNENTGTVNPGEFTLHNLGSRNDASNWFDGIIYDVGIFSGTSVTDKNRDMIIDYLCSKHGIPRLA